MTDVFTKAKRSDVMSRIRGRGNRETELALMGLFRWHGITGWRRHEAVFGKPDFIFRQRKVAIFVDGCFWHRCPLHCRQPVNNRAFWKRKLESNCRRDQLVNRTLRRRGWKIIRIWEHELARKNRARLIARLVRSLPPPT